jgi:hypothetical protein
VTSNAQVIERFAEQAGKPGARMLHPASANVMTGRSTRYGSCDEDTIFSYGRHWPLAQIMPDAQGNARGWWLVNGDRHTNSTNRHQADVRSAVQRTGLPVMILTFDGMNRAGIDRDTVKPVEVTADRYTWEAYTPGREPRDYEASGEGAWGSFRNWQQRISDRAWVCERNVHHLGESLFTAEFSYERVAEPAHYDTGTRHVPAVYVPAVRERVRGSAFFLSAFDEQEGFGLYFLCQLPEGAHPKTVAEARECLKPPSVQLAERQGIGVLRQGDVFAVQSDLMTRQLPGPSKHGEYVLGTNHKATEIRVDSGSTYARGILRHRPADRSPDHHAVVLGDRKTWYLLVKNTVPEGRAWSMGGYVD